MTTTSIELPEDLLAQVRELAQTTNRRVEEVLAAAVAQGLAYDSWFRASVEQGIHSANQGTLRPSRYGRITSDAVC
jgi:predicted transcriptional regulator